jgi:hypothetical protein
LPKTLSTAHGLSGCDGLKRIESVFYPFQSVCYLFLHGVLGKPACRTGRNHPKRPALSASGAIIVAMHKNTQAMTHAHHETQAALNGLNALADQLQQEHAMDMVQKAQALNCIEAMRTRLADNQPPEKIQWDTLSKTVESHSHLTDAVVRLGEDFGYLPSA